MSKSYAEDNSTLELNLSKKGSWEEIIDLSKEIGTLLSFLKSSDVNGEISKKGFEKLSEEWEEWRPCTGDDFSKEMRRKTARQSSIGKSRLEKKDGEMNKETGNASGSVRKAVESVKKRQFKEATSNLMNAVKCAGQVADSRIRQEVRSIEEKIYEKTILKMNSLYFDNRFLNAILSKNLGANSSERYQLTLHSNSPQLRKFFAERIDWDDC